MSDFWKGAMQGLPMGAQMGMHFLDIAREEKQRKEEREWKSEQLKQQRRDSFIQAAVKVREKDSEMAKKLLRWGGFEEEAAELRVPMLETDGETPITPAQERLMKIGEARGLTDEQLNEALFDITQPKETPAEAKESVLKRAGATDENIIRAFGGYIKTKEPQVIEIGVEGKPNYKQRAVFDFETNTITKRIGPEYKARSEAQKSTKDKMLERLASDYFGEIGRYGSALRGVGQFLPDKNKEFVAEYHLRNSTQLAQQYKNLGGDLADLGITQSEYTTPEEVKQALKGGKITREEAIKILTDQFGFEK